MALSNWLTRDEWNACYFAGWRSVVSGQSCSDLSQQLRLGIAALHQAGYKFTGIKSSPTGDYEKVTQCCTGNEAVLAEFITGDFDIRSRAIETMAWAPLHVPTIPWSWLKLVAEYNPDKGPTGKETGPESEPC